MYINQSWLTIINPNNSIVENLYGLDVHKVHKIYNLIHKNTMAIHIVQRCQKLKVTEVPNCSIVLHFQNKLQYQNIIQCTTLYNFHHHNALIQFCKQTFSSLKTPLTLVHKMGKNTCDFHPNASYFFIRYKPHLELTTNSKQTKRK